MKIFRWSGLAFFSAIILLIFIAGMFFIEPYLKHSLEIYLGEKNSATVNIDDLDIAYWPLKLELKGIQVADSQNLKINAFQIDVIDFELSLADLLLKKLIINEMRVSNVQVNTARTLAAEKINQSVEKKEQQKSDETESFSLPSIDIPDAKQLIEKEPLESSSAYLQLKQDMDETEKRWQEAKKDIADQQRWNQYEQQYNEIKKDFKGNTKAKLKALKSAKKLKQALQQEIANIRQAKASFKDDYTRLNDDFKRMREAPNNDVSMLKKKYRLDNINTENITQLLLGDKTAAYVQMARRWYKKVQPFLESDNDENEVIIERSHGRDIKFTEYNPKPDLLIKHIAVSASLPRGDFIGEIKNISSNQSINQQPMSFVLAGQNMKNKNSEEIRGEIDFTQVSKPLMWIDYKLLGENLKDVVLSRSESLPLSIAQSRMDMNMNARWENSQISAKALMNFKQVKFSADKVRSNNSMANLMLKSFADIDQFKVNADFKGALDSLKFKLRSDLDNKVGAQMKRQLKQKMTKFEQDLKQRLSEKYKAPLAKLQNRRQALDKIKQDIEQKEKQIKQRIASLQKSIDAKKKEKQQQLKDKVKSKKDELKKNLLNKLGL